MTRTLTLALFGSALIGSAALAQTSPATPTNPPAANAPATSTASPRTADANRPMFQMRQGQWRSSKIIGLNVYNNSNEDIGDINELIIGQNGQIEAVVVGVGGFLGLGEHDVAIPYNQVQFREEPRNAAGTAARPMMGTGTNTAAKTNPPATNAPANTTGAVGTTNPAPMTGTGTAVTNQPAAPIGTTNRTTMAGDTTTYRGYPDHALVSMTKDQLQALPQVRYAR